MTIPAIADAILSEEEKKRIVYHLGYPVLDVVPTVVLGVPAASQPMFLVYSAMDRIPQAAVGKVRELLSWCDVTERRIGESQGRMRASEVEGVKLNADEADMLRREYAMWRNRLASILACPVYPYSGVTTGTMLTLTRIRA